MSLLDFDFFLLGKAIVCSYLPSIFKLSSFENTRLVFRWLQ